MDQFFAAIITGDVNASPHMSSEYARSLGAMLERCFAETDAALPVARLGGLSIFRGDAWQFAVRRADLSVRAALLFRCRLLVHSDRQFKRRLHTAVAIGLGTIDYLPGPSASTGGGKAYENSGKRLDRLRRRVPGMGLAGAGDNDPYLDHQPGGQHPRGAPSPLPCRGCRRSRSLLAGIRRSASRPFTSIWRPAAGQLSNPPWNGPKQPLKAVSTKTTPRGCEGMLMADTTTLLGDYVLQPDALAERKALHRRWILVHVAVVAGVTWLLLGTLAAVWAAGTLFILHLGIDLLKLAKTRGLWGFALDQLLHLLALLVSGFVTTVWLLGVILKFCGGREIYLPNRRPDPARRAQPRRVHHDRHPAQLRLCLAAGPCDAVAAGNAGAIALV